LQIGKCNTKRDESDLVEKKYIAKLLRSLFEKDGQPQIQQQILNVLCNSVDLVISPTEMSSHQSEGLPVNSTEIGGQKHTLSDLWINYLINKTQQPKGDKYMFYSSKDLK
jgi:hypothetical protein